MLDIGYLSKFIPRAQMSVIRENIGLYRGELSRLRDLIRACPKPVVARGCQPSGIRIYMHYFGGATDIWVYALEEGGYGEAFVCLNGDRENAETGPVYIPELLPIEMLNLDLHWDTIFSPQWIMDRNDE